MPADEPGPLPRGLLDRLASRPEHGPPDTGPPDPGLLAADLAVLRDGGYLRLALPARFGGAGLNLAELACAQRQLAARAPAAAWAVNAHHAWVGAAADALTSGGSTDPGPGGPAGPVRVEQAGPDRVEQAGPDRVQQAGPAWILAEAARGRMFTGYGAAAGLGTLAGTPPGRDGPAIPGLGPRDVPGRREETLIAGLYAWALALDGMTSYAVARRAFDRAVERAGAQKEHARHRLDRWPVAEAALRLDAIRGQLDEVIANWQQRVAAGGGLTSLDPGRLSLIRQFTARYAAGRGAVRVAELAGLIAGDAVPAGRP